MMQFVVAIDLLQPRVLGQTEGEGHQQTQANLKGQSCFSWGVKVSDISVRIEHCP